MPAVLEQLVDSLGGASLDEKARKSLLEGDGVHALSILSRMAESTEVRNPSAFISSSVRSAQTKGPPGSTELVNALTKLGEAGIIDENAISKLKSAPVADACASIAALLALEDGAVRNASAYVTRNLANAHRGGHNGGGGGGAGGVVGGAQAAASYGMGGMAFLDRYQGTLDQKAMDSLRALGPQRAAEIIQEMESKGSSVRNPSAYVTRACENPPREASAAAPAVATLAAGLGYPAFDPFGGACAAGCAGGCAGYPGLYGAFGGGIVGAAPLGYSLPPAASLPAAHLPTMGGFAYPVAASPIGGAGELELLMAKYQGVLDAEAMSALQNSGTRALGVLQMLDSKAESVRNPSAYVVRSVANLDKESVGAALRGGGFGLGLGLDDKAQATLRELPKEVSDVIMSELTSKGTSINNPSAYVQRAAANARRGEGAAGAAAPGGLPPLSSPSSGVSLSGLGVGIGAGTLNFDAPGFEHLVARLDDRARDALNELGAQNTEEGINILRALSDQNDRVQNPSAYVLKSVANARRSGSRGGGGNTADSRIELEVLLAPWRPLLDDSAQRALEGLSVQAASHILGELESKKDQIRNPSAYVCKSAKNEHQGLPTGGGGIASLPAAFSSGGGAFGGLGGAGAGAFERPPYDPVAQAELNEEIAKLGIVLDQKALSALEEVGPAAGVSIIKMLAGQGDRVNNPNAYITRAAANEMRGGGSAAKRARLV